MSSPSEDVGPELLRKWGLPDPGESKKTRGSVMVVGGSLRTPGAIALAGEASLRVGAGRLGMLVPETIQGRLGVAVPESAVFALPADADEPFSDSVRSELESADAVLVGPGFDDPDETRATLLAIADIGVAALVLDAFAIGVLPDIPRAKLPAVLVLNVNLEEAAILLGRDVAEDGIADLAEIASRYRAVVNCYGTVCTDTGEAWRFVGGGPGLGTSGSGDVLAGAIAGFLARGVQPAQAAAWASWAHARAGDRLTNRMGIGFLARDICAELTPAIAEVGV
jgi:hydroxyethylthiazole kinase-like uncharacterized protein yjeF